EEVKRVVHDRTRTLRASRVSWTAGMAARDIGILERFAICTRFGAPGLDELLEAFQVAFDTPREESQEVADVLDEAFGFVRHLKLHPGRARVERGKGHHARVEVALGALPDDFLVGHLLAYLSVPFLLA